MGRIMGRILNVAVTIVGIVVLLHVARGPNGLICKYVIQSAYTASELAFWRALAGCDCSQGVASDEETNAGHADVSAPSERYPSDKTARGIQSTDGKLRYEGVYRSGKVSREGTRYWSYLRFYPNGDVIAVSSSGQPEDLREWFAKESSNVSRGKVVVTGNRIAFSAVSAQGAVDYSGEVEGNRLRLESYSHINKHREDDVFEFVTW